MSSRARETTCLRLKGTRERDAMTGTAVVQYLTETPQTAVESGGAGTTEIRKTCVVWPSTRACTSIKVLCVSLPCRKIRRAIGEAMKGKD